MDNLDNDFDEKAFNPQEESLSLKHQSNHKSNQNENYNTFSMSDHHQDEFDDNSSVMAKSIKSTDSVNIPNSSFMNALTNFLKCFIGIGILTLPKAIDN